MGLFGTKPLAKSGRVDGAAESIVELLALRLDEQGAELSTPWPQGPKIDSSCLVATGT
jgi:hypothetical protein